MSYTPTMEVPVPNISEIGLDKYMYSGREVSEVLTRRQNLKKLIEECQLEIEDLDKEIGAALDLANTKNAIWEDYLLIRRQGSKGRPILDRVLLLEAGVTPQQLHEGTREGKPGAPGVTLRHISEKQAPGYDQNPGQ